MKKMTKSILTFVLFSFLIIEDGFSQYQINDLKILVQEKNYNEALQHMKDIPPSQRVGEWKTILQQTIDGLLVTLEKDQKYAEAWEQSYQLSDEYAHLKTDPAFQSKKTSFAQKALEKYPKTEEKTCDEGFRLANEMLTKDVSLRSSRQILDAHVGFAVCFVDKASWGRPTEVFQDVLKVDSSEQTQLILAKDGQYKEKDFVENVILKKPETYMKSKGAQDLLLRYLTRSHSKTDSPEHQKARKVAEKYFLPELKKDLETTLTSFDANNHAIEIAFLLLSESGQLKPSLEREYHVRRILSGDAWGHDEELLVQKKQSLSYLKRQPAGSINEIEKKVLKEYESSKRDLRLFGYSQIIKREEDKSEFRSTIKNKLPNIYQTMDRDCKKIRTPDFNANFTHLIHESTCDVIFPVKKPKQESSNKPVLEDDD